MTSERFPLTFGPQLRDYGAAGDSARNDKKLGAAAAQSEVERSRCRDPSVGNRERLPYKYPYYQRNPRFSVTTRVCS